MNVKKLALILGLVLAGGAQAADELHLYNWNDYIAPETVERFEQVCKCKVVQDYYSDNEELLAKLAAGAKGYDILVPTSNAVEALVRQKALLPLDKSKLPLLSNLNPKHLNTPADPGNVYSVPYAFTTTLVGYNETKLKELGITPDSWAVIFDPAVLEKLKGRVTVLDSSRELMAAALIYLGHPADSRDPAHWQQAAEVIRKAKPYWAAFNASSYIKELTVGNIWVAHGYSSDMYQARIDAADAGRPFTVGFALPKEGAVIALDNMVIHKDAPRPDLAHQFINFMLEPENSAEITNFVGAGNPNQAAVPHIDPAILALQAIFPDQDTLGRLQPLSDLNAKERRALTKLWTELKLN